MSEPVTSTGEWDDFAEVAAEERRSKQAPPKPEPKKKQKKDTRLHKKPKRKELMLVKR